MQWHTSLNASAAACILAICRRQVTSRHSAKSEQSSISAASMPRQLQTNPDWAGRPGSTQAEGSSCARLLLAQVQRGPHQALGVEVAASMSRADQAVSRRGRPGGGGKEAWGWSVSGAEAGCLLFFALYLGLEYSGCAADQQTTSRGAHLYSCEGR